MAWCRGQVYAQDLRDRALAPRDLTLTQAAERFGVSRSYVSKVRARLREHDDATPGPQHNHVPLRLEPLLDAAHEQIEARPDARLRELRSWLKSAHGVSVSYPVMWKVVARLGLTLKKKHLRAKEQDREEIVEARRAWAELQPTLDPSRLVSLDETWTTTSMSPTRGWAPKGEHLVR